jgi:hypothetical protein
VCGDIGAGRTTLLRNIVRSLVLAGTDDIVWIGEPPAGLDPCAVLRHDADPDQLRLSRHTVVLVDDADRLSSEMAARVVSAVERRESSVVVSAPAAAFTDLSSPLRALRGAGHGVALQPRPGDGDPFRVTLPMRASSNLPPGEGFLIDNGTPRRVRVINPPIDHPT